MVAFTLATYLDELRNLPTEKPLEPELKAEQQKQDVKIRSEAIAQHIDAASAFRTSAGPQVPCKRQTLSVIHVIVFTTPARHS